MSVRKPSALSSKYLLLGTTLLAVALPFIWAFQLPPLPTFYSQALACALWLCVILVRTTFLSTNAHRALQSDNKTFALAWLPWMLLLATLAAHGASGLSPLFAVAPGAFAIALVTLLTFAVSMRAEPDHAAQTQWLTAFLAGVLLAALINAFAVAIQAIAPNWPDDVLIARHATGERFGGNLRQPNQLATLTVWGLIAAAYLLRQRIVLWVTASLPLVATLLVTESRTGVISFVLVVGLGLLHSRRVRTWRMRDWLTLAIVLLPLITLSVGAFTRGTADSSGLQRTALWREVMVLIEHHTMLGVGWAQLNFAWTLTPFTSRAPDVFDHAHSLPLQLAVELGLPAAGLILGIFALGLWRIARRIRTNASHEMAAAAALLLVVLIHSLLEYPLWFSYFLLPTAFMYAWLLHACSANGATTIPTQPLRRHMSVVIVGAAALGFTALIYAVVEYQKATAIHQTRRDPTALAQAVETARGSALYGQFGDYAAIMLAGDRTTLSTFDRPVRHVLDERLLTAWARALQRNGEIERAAYVAARAREFPPNLLFNALPNAPLPSSGNASAPSFEPRDFRGR